MNISLTPGTYVVAVSGGVDSMALLHLLRTQPGLRLTVAHYDHGIREDSSEDAQFVKEYSKQYGLPFVSAKGSLGHGASEALARQKRYEFLHRVRQAAGAQAIVTAHHQDDVLETAILNIIRGTGRRGVSSLKSTDIIKRPLLHVPKQDIVRYARDNQLLWHEDSTNSSLAYKRNYVRHQLLPQFKDEHRDKLHEIIKGMRKTNAQLDELLSKLIADISEQGKLSRAAFILLSHSVSREVMHAWLRQQEIENIDSKMVEKLVHAAKTLPPGKKASVNHNNYLFIEKKYLALMQVER